MTRRLIVAIVSVACAGASAIAHEVAGGTEPAPPTTFTIATASDVLTLDPHQANDTATFRVLRHVYETLVSYDADLGVVPSLAASWQRIDGRTWEFELRPGVVFHDGTPLRAADVARSLERLRDPAFAAPASFLLQMLETIDAVGDDVVRLTTGEPFAPLINHLAHPAAAIVSAATLQGREGGEAGALPGTGPYHIERWDPATRLVLRRFDEWWGSPDGPTSLVFRPVPDPAVRAIELEVGAADIAFDLLALDAARLERRPSLRVESVETLLTHDVGFNTCKPPFDDPRVRRAIGHGLDLPGLVAAVYDGAATRARGPLPAGTFGAVDDLEPRPYDADRARAALRDAGFGDRLTASLFTLPDPRMMAAAEIVQAQLADIGIDVRIVTSDAGAFLADTAAGQHDLFILGWGTVTGDADYGLYAPFHSSQGAPAGTGRSTRTLVSMCSSTWRVARCMRTTGSPRTTRRNGSSTTTRRGSTWRDRST